MKNLSQESRVTSSYLLFLLLSLTLYYLHLELCTSNMVNQHNFWGGCTNLHAQCVGGFRGGKTTTTTTPKQINKLTTFTRSQIDSIDAQVFSDPTQKMVKFDPIENWVIGDDNSIRYMMPFELEDAGNDWIGVFKVSVFIVSRNLRGCFNCDCLFTSCRAPSTVWRSGWGTSTRPRAKRWAFQRAREKREKCTN